MKTRWRVWFHRARALVWLVLAVPATLWWKDSILLAIYLSLYANLVSDWGAAEAADNSEITERLDRIEAELKERGHA